MSLTCCTVLLMKRFMAYETSSWQFHNIWFYFRFWKKSGFTPVYLRQTQVSGYTSVIKWTKRKCTGTKYTVMHSFRDFHCIEWFFPFFWLLLNTIHDASSPTQYIMSVVNQSTRSKPSTFRNYTGATVLLETSVTLMECMWSLMNFMLGHMKSMFDHIL